MALVKICRGMARKVRPSPARHGRPPTHTSRPAPRKLLWKFPRTAQGYLRTCVRHGCMRSGFVMGLFAPSSSQFDSLRARHGLIRSELVMDLLALSSSWSCSLCSALLRSGPPKSTRESSREAGLERRRVSQSVALTNLRSPHTHMLLARNKTTIHFL